MYGKYRGEKVYEGVRGGMFYFVKQKKRYVPKDKRYLIVKNFFTIQFYFTLDFSGFTLPSLNLGILGW